MYCDDWQRTPCDLNGFLNDQVEDEVEEIDASFNQHGSRKMQALARWPVPLSTPAKPTNSPKRMKGT